VHDPGGAEKEKNSLGKRKKKEGTIAYVIAPYFSASFRDFLQPARRRREKRRKKGERRGVPPRREREERRGKRGGGDLLSQPAFLTPSII